MAAKRRPQPAPDEDDADAKRARRTSGERSYESDASKTAVPTIRPSVSAASASLLSSSSSLPIDSASLTSAVVTVKESPSISSPNYLSVANNGDINPRENSFLKSTRKAILSEESTTKSASTVDVICSVPPTTDKSTTTTMSKVSYIAPSILLFLFIANLIAITYITTQRTWQSLIHMKRETELYRLNNELTASQNEVRILQVRLKALEQMWVTDDNVEELDGLLGSARLSNNQMEVLTMDERKTWMEKIRILESEKEYVLNEFRKNLSVSQELVKALKQCQIQDD